MHAADECGYCYLCYYDGDENWYYSSNVMLLLGLLSLLDKLKVAITTPTIFFILFS